MEMQLATDALNSPDASERSRARERLLQHDPEEAVAALSAALGESHWPVCTELAEAIAAIGGDAARTALVSALKARRHHVRSAAVKALVRMAGRSVRDAIEGLACDPSYEVRQDVAEALQRLDEAKR